MERERLIHDWLVQTLKERLLREGKALSTYREVEGFKADIVLESHGIVLGVIEVETEESLNAEAVEKWKEIVNSGIKLTIMVPKRLQKKVTTLCWDEGIADRVTIGTYDVVINLPP